VARLWRAWRRGDPVQETLIPKPERRPPAILLCRSGIYDMRGLYIWLGGGLSVTGPLSSAHAALAAHACSMRVFTPAATMRRISPSRDELKGVPGSRLTTSSADKPLNGDQALRDRVHRQEEALKRDGAQERGTFGCDKARRGDIRAI